MIPEVILYTDGACSGNPGPGGWGFILRHPKSGKEIERSGGEAVTTNNRMEMLAVIEGLKALTRPTSVELISDSKYVLQGLKEWLPRWKANGWKRKPREESSSLKNVELWQELDRLVTQHRIKFTHVKGHAGHPENERCDKLAVNAAKQFNKQFNKQFDKQFDKQIQR
ncbi:MAG: ribonuclease HI [Planctomycetaceae bacterium]|jgi:ribonuclease HI|nr:ribonuclease HI [Planctomycetaceae bacterium]